MLKLSLATLLYFRECVKTITAGQVVAEMTEINKKIYLEELFSNDSDFLSIWGPDFK